MKHRTIHIRGWRVDMFIESFQDNPMYDVLGCLQDMKAPYGILEHACGLIEENRPNQAFTYSNGRRTVIYIGHTTSSAEFLNSLIHEIRHLVDHMAQYYGLENNEEVAYISGDAAFLLAEDICKLGCPSCCDKKQ